MIGVPCSSVPLTMSTSSPRRRWYRAKMPDGTPKPATWPMCRGPLAYGQATATRMRRGTPLRGTSALMKVDGGFGIGGQDLADVAASARAQEEAGYDGLWSAETSHDPFFPL